jgi:hypothetical protein
MGGFGVENIELGDENIDVKNHSSDLEFWNGLFDVFAKILFGPDFDKDKFEPQYFTV